MIARAPTRSRSASVAPWISTLARLGLGGVLLAAGGLKAIDPPNSAAAVRAYELLPGPASTVVGWGLPFAEIALGLLLVAGLATRAVAAVTAVLFATFVFAAVSAWRRGLSIDCGCFGGGGAVAPGQMDYTGEILRDIGLLALTLWLVWWPRSKFALERGEQERNSRDVRV